MELVAGVDGRTRLIERPGSERSCAPWTSWCWRWGSLGPETDALAAQLGLELDARGNVRVDGGFRTSHPRVWAVGDAQRGASLIVWAISDGREAARDVDSAPSGAPSRLPSRGAHLPFGGR